MRKYCLLLIVMTSLLSCSEYNSAELIDFNLKGKIKSVTSIKYRAVEKFGEVEKGKKTSRNILDELDMQDSNISLAFNNEGDFEWMTYFDKRGNVKLKAVIKDSILNYYDSSGDLVLRSIGNNINIPTEISNYNQFGELESKIFIKYDDTNNIIDEKKYSLGENLIRTSDYKYNENNQIFKEKRLEVEDDYYSSRKDTIISFFTFTYNGNKDITEYHIQKNKEKEIKKYTYEYDENKNWIQKIEFNGLVPKYIIEREIEYYE